jgi:hypothetical protein
MAPVLYSIFVLDLNILTWDTKQDEAGAEAKPAGTSVKPATAG